MARLAGDGPGQKVNMAMCKSCFWSGVIVTTLSLIEAALIAGLLLRPARAEITELRTDHEKFPIRPVYGIPIDWGVVPQSLICAQNAVKGSAVPDDPPAYCHAIYKRPRFAGMTPVARRRAEDNCVATEIRRRDN